MIKAFIIVTLIALATLFLIGWLVLWVLNNEVKYNDPERDDIFW